MIDALFPWVRRDILALLFTRPGEAFYLREIVRATRGGRGAVAREVHSLTEAGILRRDRRGNRTYYRADPDCPIYSELRRLILKTTGLADILRRALGAVKSIRLAFVYGSAAKGTLDAKSDVDILIVTDAPFGDVSGALLPAQEGLGRQISPTVYSTQEFAEKQEARNHFLSRVLDGPKIMLVGTLDEAS